MPQYSHHLPCIKGTLTSITKIAIPPYSYLTIQVARSNVFSAAKKSVQPLALIRLKNISQRPINKAVLTIKIKCNNCSSSFGNCVQASNHFKKYHGAIKNNLPARTTTNIGKKVNNIVPTIDTPDTFATPTKGSSSIQHAAPVSTNDKLTLLEETRKELQLFTDSVPLFSADSPIPLSPDTPTIYDGSSPEDDITNTSNESIINKEPPQNLKERGESPSESDEEEDAIISRFRGLLKPSGMFCKICNKCTDANKQSAETHEKISS